MRKLITALSFATFAIAGVTGLVGPSVADDGGLRVVYEYPNSTIDDQNQPVFASGKAWARQGGTSVAAILGNRGRSADPQVAGSGTQGSATVTMARDCLGNLDGDGEPKGPLPAGCY